MQIKKAKWVIKGMNRDLSSSKFNAEYAYENMNLRLTPMDENSLLAMVNEKGPKKLVGINGIPIGETTIGDSLIIFTTNSTGEIETYMDAGTKEYYIPEDPNIKTYIDDINNAKDDYIYKAYVGGDGNYKVDELYHGDLNFNTNSPIEALSVYENEDIQKVYWVDGRNQPRLINVARDNTKFSNSHFNFIRSLNDIPHITMKRLETTNGSFPSGVIQYVCTYYDRYAQETNIVWSSPLYYISFTDRGASPEEKVSCGFQIDFYAVDKTFDCVRIYSILRTSLDATPICKRIVDINIPKDINKFQYIDNGTIGDTIDPTELLYKGGEEIIASTIAQKDNTLFLGNYSMKRKSLSAIKKYFKEKIRPATDSNGAPKYKVSFSYNRTRYNFKAAGYYPYKSQLNSSAEIVTTYKYKETYRFGVQFLHKSGVWSEPVWLGDFKNDNCPPKQSEYGTLAYNKNVVATAEGSYSLYSTYLFNELQSEGYIAARPLVVFPDINDREVICQGVLNPTVYNMEDRYGNSPFAQSSWFFRPYAPINVASRSTDKVISADTTKGYSIARVVISNSETTINEEKYQMSNRGTWVEFRTDCSLGATNADNATWSRYNMPQIFGEIQSLSGGCPNTWFEKSTTNADTYVSEHKDSFYVDQSIVTIHSPEIEFDDQIQHIDSDNLKLRIIGMVPFTSCKGNIDIETSTPQQAFTYGDAKKLDLPIGFYKEPVGVTTYLPGGNPNLDHSDYEYLYGWKMLAAGAFWFDQLYDQKFETVIYDTYRNNGITTAFVIYPWHRNGSLSNQNRAITDKDKDLKDYRYSMLKKKRLSNFRTSFFTTYFVGDWIWNAESKGSNTKTGISGFRIFNSNEVSLVRLPAPKNSSLPDINYYGNIDKIIKHNYRSNEGKAGKGYPIMITGMGCLSVNKDDISVDKIKNDTHDLFNGRFREIVYGKDDNVLVWKDEINSQENTYGIDPIRMKYKSSIHGVIALNYTTDNYRRVLPRKGDINIEGITLAGNGAYQYFWDADCKGVSQDSIELGTLISEYRDANYYGFLWMGELYRDSADIVNRFGGDTEEALENNKWIAAGPTVHLNTDNQQINNEGEAKVLDLTFNYGDTYYQRYDHIKTYPFTTEDQNQILEILSFMCESRINLDGRYDKNRGQVDNFSLTPTNMNLMNPVYSQKNNFFTYRTFNEDKLQLDDFHNSITWTKTKTAGELVDSWTNVTLASTMDFDGDKGNITALRKWNNNLLAFQNKAISQILYNENTQISTTEGVPIEIANSGKVQGKRYITDNIGCSNKWSISVTPTGIYFIDNITKALYLFNGSIGNVSDSKGFHSWFNDNAKGLQAWKPNKFNNLATYYDYINRELFIIGKNSALVYSDLVNDFTSFYNYENSPYFINLNNDGVWTSQVNNGKYNKQGQYYLWQHQKGEYNNFFGAYYPFYTTVVANDNPDDDKIFNNLEFESDSYDTSNNLTKDTFDYLEAWTEYQKGVHSLSLKGLSLKIAGIRSDDSIKHASSLKKKFRVWRANIPRNNTGINGVEPNKRDRIRNTWAYIKLMRKNEDEDNNKNNQKTILHNMIIDYLG